MFADSSSSTLLTKSPPKILKTKIISRVKQKQGVHGIRNTVD